VIPKGGWVGVLRIVGQAIDTPTSLLPENLHGWLWSGIREQNGGFYLCVWLAEMFDGRREQRHEGNGGGT
jgi:hypothetical protein